MRQIRPYQLTEWTEEHLVALAQVFNKGHNVNYAFFEAFNNLMKNMELVRRIYSSLSGNSYSYRCTKTEFMKAAERISQMTPLEVEILFAMADLNEADGKLTMSDIERITPFEEGVLPYKIVEQQSTGAEESFTFFNNSSSFWLLWNLKKDWWRIHFILVRRFWAGLSIWTWCCRRYRWYLGRLSHWLGQNSPPESEVNWCSGWNYVHWLCWLLQKSSPLWRCPRLVQWSRSTGKFQQKDSKFSGVSFEIFVETRRQLIFLVYWCWSGESHQADSERFLAW